MREVAIVSATRTAIGTYGASLKDIPVVDLGATVIRNVLEKTGCRPTVTAEVAAAGPEALKEKQHSFHPCR